MPRHFLQVYVLILIVAGSAAVFAAQDPAGDAPPPAEKPMEADASLPSRPDEIWLISTRHLGGPYGEDPGTDQLDVRRYDRQRGEWWESSAGEFFDQPPCPTVIFVHGNRVNWFQSVPDGWRVYETVAASEHAPPALRFVIWTWPSDRIHGQLKDVRVKADRADHETFYLGSFLARCNSGDAPSLIGYSYGARIVTGGMHLLAGGSLHGRSLPQPASSNAPRHRVALLAAAMDCDWLSPGHWHGDALQRTDRLLVLFNTCDPVLKRYVHLDRCSGSALGFLGSCGPLGDAAVRVEELNVAPVVGRSHDDQRYFASATLQAELGRLLFAPLPTANSAR